MKKLIMGKMPWVTMKDDIYKDCMIRLVYQWTRTNIDKTNDEMGIIVIQPNDPKDSHPFSKTYKLDELDFVAFR